MQLLDEVYKRLPPATALPSGRYMGVRPGADWAWEGKEFVGEVVWNEIAGMSAARGQVTLVDGEVVIEYRWLGARLRDHLRPLGTDAWLGYFDLGHRVYFVLVKDGQ